MTDKFISIRNMKFLLFEVFDVLSLSEYPYFSQHNQKMYNLVLDAALKLSTRLLHPVFEEMDRNPPELIAGQVKVHPAVAGIMKEFGQGGWISATFPAESSGEQLPSMVANACFAMFFAANYSASVYPGLTAGAARLIDSFGNEVLKKTFLSKMLSGQWQGTMALTEPQAGSSLTDIATTALPTADGYYKIRGRKTFISAGDHDGAENIVHLMLARSDGAPAGPKGISLFVVPKMRLNEDGILASNDISVSQIFHKMGYRGAPITELSIGDKDNCRGYLLGEPHRGLAYMFQMMNEERIGVGLGAASIASAAYYAALHYCKQRSQGRRLTDKDPASPQIAIIEHADVKRMLLFQRAVVEGSFSLLMQCCKYEDMTRTALPQDKSRYRLLLELLTPVAKTYASEMGILSTSQSIQCFGGYGYCQDFPVEQHYRDMRIHPIHEGTTGIQGMDLLGRKVVMENGKAFALFLEEVQCAMDLARKFPALLSMVDQLDKAVKQLQDVTNRLAAIAHKKGPEVFLADATLYLEFFGIVTVAWQWLLQAVSVQNAQAGELSAAEADFYQGKSFTARYFFAYELPKISGLAQCLSDGNPLTVEMRPEFFSD
jgi:alkylation response protein AidB-like acyl-CoA dehydrogenase